MLEHVAIINSDGRGRFSLAKWVDHDVPYKVFVLGDKSVRLEPVREVQS